MFLIRKMKNPQYNSLVRKQDTLNQFRNSDGKGCNVKLKIVGIYPEVKNLQTIKTRNLDAREFV